MDARRGMDAELRGGVPCRDDDRILEAIVEERQRLASELHDSIGGTLAAVEMGLTALHCSTAEAETKDKLRNLLDGLREALAEVRTFSFALQLPWCEPGSTFERAVAMFVTGFEMRPGLKASVEAAPCCGTLDHVQELALMRMLQEALLNVHRHARASSVHVNFGC